MKKKFWEVTGLPEGTSVDIEGNPHRTDEIYTLNFTTSGKELEFSGISIHVEANASEAVGCWFPRDETV